ncbi:hypothetical protein CL644_02635 [bacterium]|nr:hypothetical protein [Parcubacteria group bacterium]MBF05580.1 hypothetical protein [bacterium]|tara:strand:- start:17034 stop:17456 length:423 start_codon:yes stop_codon:yes gene_type:complete
MAAIIAFSISLGLLVLFLSFKLFEHERSFTRYVALRVKVDRVVLDAIRSIKEHGNSLEKQLSIKNIASISIYRTASIIARSARTIENRAQDVTRKMSRNGNGEARTTKSSFLEEVATHKNGLDTNRVRRETSLTDNETRE